MDPWVGGSPGVEGNGGPLQFSCLGNPMNRGAWWATVHGVTKSWTRLKRLCLLTCIVALQCGVSLCRTAKLISYKFAYILPSWASLSPPPPSLPSRSSQNTELPVLCSRCPLATRDICTHGSLHVSVPIFQFIPPTPSTRPSSTTAVSCREYESYLNKTVKGGGKSDTFKCSKISKKYQHLKHNFSFLGFFCLEANQLRKGKIN